MQEVLPHPVQHVLPQQPVLLAHQMMGEGYQQKHFLILRLSSISQPSLA